MAYDSYRDSNGVVWTVAQSGWKLLAYVPDESPRRYDPPPPDVVASMPSPTQIHPFGVLEFGPTEDASKPSAEQVRVMFVDLTGQIEKYAQGHRGQLALEVRSSVGSGVWALVLLGVLVLGGKRRRM